jgi:osmotically-inducible protein OsmY
VIIDQLALQEDIVEELAFDPRIVADDIAVATKAGIVTLRGSVPSLRQKWAAEEAVKRVRGVRGVADELLVDLPASHVRNDTDIAVAIQHRFSSNGVVPADVQFVVRDGHVTVSGTVQWYYQAHEVAHEAGRVKGVLGVTNHITIEKIDQVDAVNTSEVRRKIHGLLQRAADLDANCISVAVKDGTVTLSGTVRTWLEHDKAVQAAWSVPGVSRVDNCIAISTI